MKHIGLLLAWIMWTNGPSGWNPFDGYESFASCQKDAQHYRAFQIEKDATRPEAERKYITAACFPDMFDPRPRK